MAVLNITRILALTICAINLPRGLASLPDHIRMPNPNGAAHLLLRVESRLLAGRDFLPIVAPHLGGSGDCLVRFRTSGAHKPHASLPNTRRADNVRRHLLGHDPALRQRPRSEEHTSELQSL